MHLLILIGLTFFVISARNIYAEDVNNPKDKNVSIEQSTPNHPFGINIDENDTDHFMHEFINMMTTLGIIVAFVLIATWFLKRTFNTRIEQLNTSSVVKVVERRILNPKTTIILLEIQGKGFILAESINGVTHLGDFDAKGSDHLINHRGSESNEKG